MVTSYSLQGTVASVVLVAGRAQQFQNWGERCPFTPGQCVLPSWLTFLPTVALVQSESLSIASHMLIINTKHYVRGLAAQGSTKIENGVRDRSHCLSYGADCQRLEFLKTTQRVSIANWTISKQDWSYVGYKCAQEEGRQSLAVQF